MVNVDTIITRSNANVFFGNCDPLLGNLTLESTLRFIALKHHRGDIATIKSIHVETEGFCHPMDGNSCARKAKERGIELYILIASRGTIIPTISEDGWVSLDTPPYPVAPFLASASETRVYSNTEIKSTIIFVRRTTERWIDLLCSSMFRVLPWYFAEGMSDDETSLFRAISKQDTETFNSIINTLCSAYDFQGARYKKVLIGWNDGYRKKRIAYLEKQCADYHSNIEYHQREIASLLNSVSRTSLELLALKAQENNTDDSVYKFFMAHKQITICSTRQNDEGNTMEYCVTETMEYFDSDAFIRLYKNPNSSIGEASQDVKDVFYGVFAENKGLFRVEGMFRLSNLSSLIALKRSSGQFLNTHIPHPHLYHHACLGGNGKYINEAFKQGNWDLAIEQTIAAVKNINFGDHIVVGAFVDDVKNSLDSPRKCILADNGKEMTLREFLTYIRMSREIEGTENG